ncbi:hypothetical protein [Streptomyces sp. SUK 48]|nr:hypothetical protein [Streptomyces sp. SUK 48]
MERETSLTPKVARRLKDREVEELVAAYEAGSTLRQLTDASRSSDER